MIILLIIGALMIGGVYGIVGIGYSLIYKSSGLMSLCQGDMLMFGAFIGLTFNKFLQLPFFVALILTMVVMFLLGMGIQKFLITPLLKKGAQVAYVILCTVAISMILQNFAMLEWGSQTFQFPAVFGINSIEFLGVTIAPEQLLVLIIALVCMVALHLFMRKTLFGTAIRAAALSEIAASSMGINVPMTKGVAWGLAASLAGAIGVCLGPVYGVYTAMGILIGQKGFAGAVSGGYGNIYGAMIGGMFFGFLETFVSAYVTTAYKDFISFAVLIVVMIFMPKGLFREEVLE